jgi:hypothetical protein
MLRRSKAEGSRFLTGLMAGELVSAVFLATALYSLGAAVALVVPALTREVLLGIVVAGFGVADLRNRTPHVWRQVPQKFVRSMAPGRLGLVWGLDLGLLFTTQKSTSLLWVALAAVGLLSPASASLVLPVMAFISVLTVVVRSVFLALPKAVDISRPWFAPMRRTLGVAQVGLAVVVVLGAWL